MSHRAKKAILFIIEDDVEMRSLLSDFFASEGYVVKSFSDATEALLEMSKPDGHADVIISDLNLPKMSGMAFLEKAKLIDPTIPVILVTAFGSGGTKQEAFSKGAAGYFSKPFQLLEVSAFVQNAIGRRS